MAIGISVVKIMLVLASHNETIIKGITVPLAINI